MSSVDVAHIVQSVLSSLISAAVAAVVFLLFWSKMKKRFLDDRYKIPLVDINPQKDKVRNVGQETAINVLVFHIKEEIPELTGREGFTGRLCAHLPNLIPGETYETDMVLESCYNNEFFLIQYSNLSGVVFWCLQFADDGKGNPLVTIPPVRVRGSFELPPCVGDEFALRIPSSLIRKITSIKKQRSVRGSYAEEKVR